MMEFAIVAPILFGLVFGIYDFGRCMSANVTVTNSAREGARYGAAHTSTMAAGTVSGANGRFGFQCSTGSPLTVSNADGPTGAAWRQLQASNLDLTQVSITVSYYSSNNDPATSTAADETQSCNGTTAKDVGADKVSAPTYSPHSGDWVRVDVQYTYSPVTPVISSLVHNAITIDQTATMVLE
jgi:Flp pilus assembly protein TadG